MNPAILKLLQGKTEQEAITLLGQFKAKWRIYTRNGEQVPYLLQDRDDRRYNLMISNNIVEKVIVG